MTVEEATKPVILPVFEPNFIRSVGSFTTNIHANSTMALAILDQWKYAHQRSIREATVRANFSKMQHGEWDWSEINAVITPEGKVILVNGYHRLHALSRMDPDFEAPFRLSVQYAANDERVSAIYATFDRGALRSINDLLKARQYAEDWGIPFEVIRSASAASALIASEFAGGRSNSMASARGRSVHYRFDFIEAWKEEIISVARVIQQATDLMRKYLLRSPVAAVMLMTFRYEPEKAESFWSEVASMEGLRHGTGQKVLVEFLLNHSSSSFHEHIYARYIANAWNAYRSGESIVRVQVKTEGLSLPIVIEGTPYSRGNRQKALRLMEEIKARSRRRPKNGEEETVSKVSSGEKLLGALPSLLDENYGPQPINNREMVAHTEQGGTR